MFKVLILPCIGVMIVLLLRTHKEEKTIPIFKYNEETNVNGDSTEYIKESWETENNERKNGKSFD